MTKKEKQKLIKALDFLLEEESKGGDFQEGISILCNLLGFEDWYAKMKKMPLSTVRIQDVPLNSKFKVNL